jgi:hypothetical protein
MNRTIKRILILAAATGLTITTLASASYYFGVRPLENELNTQQLEDLNNNVTDLANRFNQTRSELADALDDLDAEKGKTTSLTEQLRSTQADLEQANSEKVTLAAELEEALVQSRQQAEENSRLETLLGNRMKSLVSLAEQLDISAGDRDFDQLLAAITEKVMALKDSGGADSKWEDMVHSLTEFVAETTGVEQPEVATSDDLSTVIQNLVNHVTQYTLDYANQQTAEILQLVGDDVTWLYYGPEYRTIANPADLFAGDISVYGKQVRVRDATGEQVTVQVVATRPTDFNGMEMIWNGFGWMIFREIDGVQMVYSEVSDEETKRALGMGWLPMREIFEMMTLANGEHRVVLWGSPKRQLAKAFVPTLPVETGWTGEFVQEDATRGYETGIVMNPYNGNVSEPLQQNLLPNSSFVTEEQQATDYEAIKPADGRDLQTFYIQKANPWKEVVAP